MTQIFYKAFYHQLTYYQKAITLKNIQGIDIYGWLGDNSQYTFPVYWINEEPVNLICQLYKIPTIRLTGSV